MTDDFKTRINAILDGYLVDEAVVNEINAEIDRFSGELEARWAEGDAMGFTDGRQLLPDAVNILDRGQVTQAEIRDWAILHGYTLIKVNSIAARLKLEKVVREIWGNELTPDKCFPD